MEIQNNKCSSIEHKEVDAIKYCQECNVYLCNKCDKFHGSLFQTHHTHPLNKDLKDIFTGFCKVENHKNELNYFCKNHNELICAKCMTKIKSKGIGQHTDCNVCDINDISEEKKKNLEDNIKKLEDLSKLFQASIDGLKKIFDEVDKNKEEVKKEIQNVFTKIRSEINQREEGLLNEVDKIFQKKIFNQDIDIFKDKKFPEKIKSFIEKGKLVEKDWENNKNKNSLINDCINIEKTINKINKLNESIESYKIKQKKLKFYSESKDLIGLIKRHGSFNVNNINQQEISIDIDNFNPQNLSCVKEITNNFYNGSNYMIDNICFFISRNDEYVLGYIDNNSGGKSIIFYDVNNNKEIKKINNAHGNSIYIIKYYDYSKYDMILSTSSNNDIKIWNYNECLNILTISSIFYYSNYYYPASSSCIIFDKNSFNIFCVTASCPDYIKLYDFKGNLNNNIGNNNEYRYYIDSCELDEKKYLIVGGNKGVQVFNYPDLSQYYCFIEGNDSQSHYHAKIVETNKGYNLIDVGSFNAIKIWDFINKNLISKINSDTNNNLQGFVIINSKYLFIGSGDKGIKEFDIQNKAHVQNTNKHTSTVVGLKPIKDKNNKTYIVSYGQDKKMILWEFK